METYLPLWGFIALMVGTPGPANLLLMSAGARHGFAGSFPFLLGLTAGKLLLNIGVSLGLVTLLSGYPLAANAFAFVSAGYMIFLAVQGWTPSKGDAEEKRAFGFSFGLIVHPLNPKAWTMSTLAFTQFAVDYATVYEKYILVPLSFVVGQLVFHSLWCMSGALLKTHLTGNVLLHRTLVLLTIAVILWAVLLH